MPMISDTVGISSIHGGEDVKSTFWRQSAVGTSATALCPLSMPALLNAPCSPPKRAYRELDHGLRVTFVRDVGANENRCATLVLDLADDPPSSLNIAICYNDGRTARRDQP